MGGGGIAPCCSLMLCSLTGVRKRSDAVGCRGGRVYKGVEGALRSGVAAADDVGDGGSGGEEGERTWSASMLL